MQKYKSEHQPTWKLISKTPPPSGTKILLRMKYGTAVIGQYYQEGGFTHWCGLPKLSGDDKHEMVG
jgi:hypothetical protein